MAPANDTRCRVCAGDRVSTAGTVEYGASERFEVLDCADCGCRFTSHDPAVYDQLHRTGAIDYYAGYRDIAESAGRAFAARDIAALRAALPDEKYRFVMDELDRLPRGARVLEMGCSRGYLTAYALLRGLDAVGVDASADAIAGARAAFGERFFVAGSRGAEGHGPLDFAWHVGMIGCVADPLGLTEEMLRTLAPGGRLAFNAPNRAALRPGELWFESAPPPDLVTLFPPGFWQRRFESRMKVREDVRLLDSRRALAAVVQRRIRGRAGHAAARAAARIGLQALVAPQPAPFGIFVTMGA